MALLDKTTFITSTETNITLLRSKLKTKVLKIKIFGVEKTTVISDGELYYSSII